MLQFFPKYNKLQDKRSDTRKLLTILVAFSSEFMRRGAHLFILLQEYA